MEFYIVDAFTDKAFGGNPAGVVLINNDIKTETRQSIAAELRFSETAFVKQIDDNSFDIKYFTPNSEVELCGHATISSFSVLLEKGLVKQGKDYIINTLAGRLTVHINNQAIMMEQAEPKISDSSLDIEKLSDILGIHMDDMGDGVYPLKPAIVSTGLWDIMLPVRSEDVLNAITPDFERLSQFSHENNVVGVHAFTLDSNNYTANCRNFAPLYDINEEAATGTSNGALTFYLYTNNYIPINATNHFLQGVKMGRPSVITTQLYFEDKIRVLVGGTCRILSKGELFI